MEERKEVVSLERRVADFMIKWRHYYIIAILLLTAFFTYCATTFLSINVILEELVPPFHPYVKLHRRFEKQFGGANVLLVEMRVKEGDIFNVKTLKKFKALSDDILFYPDVYRALLSSIAQRKMKAIRGYGGGVMDVSALMWPVVPETKEQIEVMKENVFTNELYNGVLVSKDGKAALIIADFKENIDYAKLFRFLQDLKKRTEDDNIIVHMAGRPILLGWIYHYLPQMTSLFAFSFGFVIFSVLVIFRSTIGIIIPLIAGLFTAIWGLGFIGLVGINVNPLMLLLPFLVFARALSHSVQCTRRYLEEYNKYGEVEPAARATIEGLFLAGLSAIATDAAGFLVLVFTRIIAIQQIALMCTFWVASIFLVVVLMGPILGFYLPVPRVREVAAFSKPLERLHAKYGGFLVGKGRWYMIGTWLLIGAVTLFIARNLVVGDIYAGSPILWPYSQYNRDVEEINTRFDFAGTDTLNIVIEGEENTMVDPKVLHRIEALEKYITKRLPDVVGGTQSLVPIVKKLNAALHEGDPSWEVIPETPEAVGFTQFLYRSKGDPEDFNRYTDPHYRNGNILIFFKNHKSDTIKKGLKEVENFLNSRKPIDNAKFKMAAGTIGITAAINEEVAWSQVGTLALIMIAVFIFLIITFHSITGGIILVIPLLIANLAAFAYMAMAGIGLDINTLPVSAVGIGVGVDYGIYLLSRIKEEFTKEPELEASIIKGLSTAGNGIIYTATTLVIPLLPWYIFSALKFQAEMGLLLAFLLAFNAVGALTFIPAAVYAIKPKFLRKLAA